MSPGTLAKYRRILEADPRSRIFVELARALVESGEPAEAAALCERGLAHHPDSLQALLVWAQALAMLGRASEAAAALAQAAEKSPADPRPRALLAQLGIHAEPGVAPACPTTPTACAPAPSVAEGDETALALPAFPPPAQPPALPSPALPDPQAAPQAPPLALDQPPPVPPPLPEPPSPDPGAGSPLLALLPALAPGGEADPDGELAGPPACAPAPPDASPAGALAAPTAASGPAAATASDALTPDVRRTAEEEVRTYEHALREELAAAAPSPPRFTHRHLVVAALVTSLLALGGGAATFVVLRHRHRAEHAAEAVLAARLGLARGTLGSLREAARVLAGSGHDAPDDPATAELAAEVAALLWHDHGDVAAGDLARRLLSEGRVTASAAAVRWLLAPSDEASVAAAALLAQVAPRTKVAAPDGDDGGRASGAGAPPDVRADDAPPLARALAGDLLLCQGDRTGARRELEAAARAVPPLLRAGVSLGDLLLADGDAEAALAQQSHVLHAEPHHPGAALGAAEACLALERELTYARELLEAVEADPASAPAAEERQRLDLVMARLLAAEGRANEADRRLAGAAARRPDDPAVALTRAEVRARTGDLDSAIVAAEEALRAFPADASRRELLARLRLRRGLFAEVLTGTELSPSRRLRLDRGIALAELGQPERARAELEATRRDGKMTTEAAAWMALVDLAQGRKEEAAALTLRLLAAPTPHAVALLARGRLDLLARDVDAAERHLRAALERDLDLLPARRDLASLLLSLDRAAEARELLRQGLARSPWDAPTRRLFERAEHEAGQVAVGAR